MKIAMKFWREVEEKSGDVGKLLFKSILEEYSVLKGNSEILRCHALLTEDVEEEYFKLNVI
jgi:hypothetical protein